MSEHNQQTYIAHKPRFFISYARDDGETYAKELQARLIPIFGEKSIWRDREDIKADNQAGWWKQITEALDNVEYMLLVASPLAMESKNVRKEWRYARSKGVTVCPILLPDKDQHPDFKNLPFSISEKHFYELTHQWDTLIGQLKENGITTKIPFSAPDMPKNFVQRPDIFNRLKSYLLKQSAPDAPKNPVTISTAMKGAGGFGKTVMATALAYDEEIQNAYLDGIVWVELGETPDLTGVMNKIYNQLSRETRGFTDITDARNAIKDLIVTKNILLIVDDVWKAYHIKPFLDINPMGATLVTTRYVDVVLAANADAQRIDVDEMTSDEAVELLMATIPYPATLAITDLAERLGNWALMMTLANGMLRKRLQRQGAKFTNTVDWVNDELDEEGVISITSDQIAEERHRSAGKTIEICFRALEENEQADARMRYLALGIFPEGANIPNSALYRVWGCKERRAEKYAEQLDDLSLVKYNVATESLTLHDVVWKYAQERLGDDAKALHNRLIEAYGNLHNLPDDYAWRNIAYHLMEANQPDQLRKLLLTYSWLDKKLTITDIDGLLQDYTLLLAHGKDEPIRLIRSAISNSIHRLVMDNRAFAHQLAGRLMHHRKILDEIQTFIENIILPQNSLYPMISDYDSLNPAGGYLNAILVGHTDDVKGVIQLSDGRLLSWSADKTLRLWDKEGTPITSLTHVWDVTGALELADGRLLSWSNNNNTLRLWESDGSPINNLTHKERVAGALELADGRLLSWGYYTLRLWESDGLPITALTKHMRGLTGVLELADGRLLSWGYDTLRLWELDGSPFITLIGHTDSVTGALELADGRLLSWSGDKTLRLWESDGSPITTLKGHTGSVTGALELADGRLLSWSNDHTLRLWESDGSPISTFTGHTGSVIGILELTDGRLLSWSKDYTLRLWESDSTPITTLKGHIGSVGGALALADGRFLSWSDDHTLSLWESDGTPISTLTGHIGSVGGVLALADGRLLSWSDDHTPRLWESGGTPITALTGHIGSVWGVLALADGRLLSCNDSHTLRLWRADGIPITTLTGHIDHVKGTLILANGRFLSWSNDHTLRLWESDGTPISALTGHTSYINGGMAVSNGQLLSWSGDKTLRLWESDGTPITTLKGHMAGVRGALELADRRLLSWSTDATLRLWESDGSPITTLRGHTEIVTGALELTDGRLLSWSGDKTLRLWESDGTPITALIGHTDRVSDTLILDNERILSWSYDKTLRLWESDGTPVTTLIGHIGNVTGSLNLANRWLLSWSGGENPQIRLWSSNGVAIDMLEQEYDGGDRLMIATWAQKHGLILDDIYPYEGGTDPIMAGGRVQIKNTDLIIYDMHTGEAIYTFYGDAPFMCVTVLDDGRVVVAGDRAGRVVFLRWIGENTP